MSETSRSSSPARLRVTGPPKTVRVGDVESALRAVDFELGQAVGMHVETHVDRGEGAAVKLECAHDVRRDFDIHDFAGQGLARDGALREGGAGMAAHGFDGADELD